MTVRFALTPHEWDTAQKVCTRRQIQVLDLRRRGWSLRRCAIFLDISEGTIRGHIEAAERRITRHLEHLDGEAA